MFRLFFLLNFLTLTHASYCGQSAIPFSIEILQNGQPVLGCARPTCFGWDAYGKRAADAAMFYRIGQQMDGFLRSFDKAGVAVKNVSMFQPQFSICERTYLSDRCIGQNQWVGGIAPLSKIDSHESMKIMCCIYEKLRDSASKGVLKIRPGQSIQGGEKRNEVGRQHAFEYVSNIERMFDEHGVVYTVQMRSFNCVPEPNGPAKVDDNAEKYLIENIDAIDHPTTTPQPPPTERSQSSSGITFDERTFELPEDMPAEEVGEIPTVNVDSPSRRIVGNDIPVAQPYEESAIRASLNDIQRQVNQKHIADSEAFRSRAHGAPTLNANISPLSQQQTAFAANSHSLPQSHSPYYAQQQQLFPQMNANPLDPFGLFNSRNPFGWYIPTSPPTPSSKVLPLEIPTVEQVENAIPKESQRIIASIARTLSSYFQ